MSPRWGSGSVYEVGDLAKFTVMFRDPDTDALIDPSNVIFRYEDPFQAQASFSYGVDPQVVKVAAGQYMSTVDLTEPGVWTFRWETAGAYQGADEFRRHVIGSTFNTPVNTVPPVLTGTPTVGQTLSCSTGSWTRHPTSFAYQWLRDDVPISGATAATYQLLIGDYAHEVSCAVVATNDAGDSAAAQSVPVDIDVPVPINTVLPVITLANEVPGATAAASTGTWTTSSTPTYAYQWERCDVAGANPADISGATASSYILTEADLDHTIRVRVTATDQYGSTSARSVATDAVHFASQNIFIDPLLGSTSNVNWSTFSQNSTFFFGGALASTTAQNSEITFEFYAEAGVYTLDLLLVNSTNRGVYTVFIDGASLDTLIDGYSSATTVPRATLANVQIASTGTHSIRLLMATKNAASSGYEGCVSAITFTRAGDL